MKTRGTLFSMDDPLVEVLEKAGFPTLLATAKSRIVFATRSARATFGYSTTEEMCEQSLKNLFDSPTLKEINKIVRGEGEIQPLRYIEGKAVRKDETSLSCIISVTPLQRQEKWYYQISCIDISQKTELVEKLSSSETRLASLINESSEAVAVVRENVIAFANPAFSALFALEADPAIAGMEYASLLPEEPASLIREALKRATSGKNIQKSFEFTLTRKDGSRFDCEVALAPLKREGAETEILLFHLDRTEVKRLERELQQKATEGVQLNEMATAISSSMDPRKIVQTALHKLMDITRMEIGAVFLQEERKHGLHLAHHRGFPEALRQKLPSLEYEEGIGGLLSKTLEPHAYTIQNYPSYLPYRSLFAEAGWTSIAFVPLISKGILVGLILAGTRKKQNELTSSIHSLLMLGYEIGAALTNARLYERIKDSEEQYRRLIESISDVIYRSAPNGAFLFISPKIEQLTGYTAREFQRNKNLWLSLVHPEDKHILLERTTSLEELGDRSVLEYRLLPKAKAAYRWIRDEITLLRDDNGGIHGINGILSDVSAYKELSEGLRQSDDLKTSILSSIQEGVVVYDQTLKCIEWNGAMEKITGLPRNEVIGRNVDEIFTGSEQVQIAELLKRSLSGEVIQSEDLRYKTVQSRKNLSLWGRYSPLRNSTDEIIGVVGILTDVSERVSLERGLKESEQILRNVIDTMSDLLIITDLKGSVLQMNRAFTENLGYSRNEAIGVEFPYPWLIEEEMGRYVIWISNLREKNWLHDFDMTWRAKNGRLISMSLSTTLLKNSVGEPLAMLNIARDISERKRLAGELESRNKQVELLNRIISTANETLDFDEIFSKIAEEVHEIVPVDAIDVTLTLAEEADLEVYAAEGHSASLKGRHISSVGTLAEAVIQSRTALWIDNLVSDPRYRTACEAPGIHSLLSLPIVLKGRTLGTLNLAAKQAQAYSEQHASLLLPIAQQIGAIIDRSRLFKQVSDDATYIHNLLDSIDSVVYTVDRQFRILEVNEAWYGYMRENGVTAGKSYYGHNILDVLPHESLQALFKSVARDVLGGALPVFSQEISQDLPSGRKIYQLSINPMVIDGKITGLVITHTDITALKQTELELTKNNQQLLALNAISTLISTSMNLEDILSTAIPILKQTMEARGVLVYLVDASETSLELAKGIGFDYKEIMQLSRLVVQGSATGVVVQTKEPIYIPSDAWGDERILYANRDFLKKEGIEGLAIIPLLSKDKVLGALVLFFPSRHDFTKQERQLLTLIGNQLGTAIENAQLYTELRSQIDRLTVLYEFSEQISSILDIGKIFDVMYEHVHRLLVFENFSISLYDEVRKTITPALLVEVRNNKPYVIPQVLEPARIESNSDAGHVLSSKRSFINPGRTLILIPMLSKQSLIGIMQVAADPALPFTETQLRLLESIGNLAAIALEKAKLYEETVHKSLEIERRNKELDDFTYVVSHDLKEPLISIEGFARILESDYQDTLTGDVRDYLDSIMGAANRMKGLIDDLLTLSRVSRLSESFKPVSITEIIDDVRIDLEFSIRQKGAVLEVAGDLPVVYGNETHLKVVFRNLIGNALKFNENPHPTIEIGFRNAENNCYLFFVKDNGIGIEADFHEKIFVVFQRLHRREEYEGTGAGLAIVKKIVEMHKGTIWVESEPSSGSTFFFTIPKFNGQD